MDLKQRLEKLGVWDEFVDEFLMQESMMFDITEKQALKELEESINTNNIDLSSYIVYAHTVKGETVWRKIRKQVLEME